MRRKVGRMQTVAWLGVAYLVQMPLVSLSAQEPKLRHTLKGHTDWVLSVRYSPDGKMLASGSMDETIKLWDARQARNGQLSRGTPFRCSP